MSAACLNIDELTLGEIKERLKLLNEKYIQSLEKDIEGDKVILEHIKLYEQARTKLLKKVKKDNPVIKLKKNSSDPIIIDTIKFNSKNGTWDVSYHQYGKSFSEVYSYGHSDVVSNKSIYDALKKKTSNSKLKNIGMNLFSILTDFDKKHNTNITTKYLENEKSYDITYNLTNLFSTKYYNYKEKIELLKEAYKQKRCKNATVINPKNMFLKPSVALLVLFLGISSTSLLKLNRKDNNSFNKGSISTVTTDSNSIDDSNDIYVEAEKTSNVKKVIKTTYSSVTASVNEEVVSDEVSDDKTLEEDDKLFLHDSFYLNDLETYNRVLNPTYKGNINNISCDHYKISLISVCIDNTILEIEDPAFIDNNSINDVIKMYQDKYGNNASIWVNFNGYDNNDNKTCSDIGWTNINNLEKVEKKNSITNKKLVKRI